ncbi:cuticle protein CP14.6-like [Sitodiplosis mosellana]|uniref:cuticle protein CP14.6-like n=1 Tax=Sitodiplosis mosellana TaxID=263140 RepID=UPI002443E683|nr:cuticle protein CP14.6-like [Sitodiplosis mosellana]
MKFVAIALFALVAGSYAIDPFALKSLVGSPHHASSDATAQVLRNDAVVNPESFNYAYETSNGITAKEQGQLKQIGSEAGITAQGDYAYTSPEGEKVQLSYIADENGFQPTGSHLPVAPAIPAQIARALEYLQHAAPQAQYTPLKYNPNALKSFGK